MRIFDLLYALSRKSQKGVSLLRLLYGCDIAKGAKIDSTVSFPHHALGVVIAPGSIIEGGVTIQHHVTIAMKDSIDNTPHIERNVYVGAYALIIGKITIGENSVIGAGSIVTKSIPPNTTYVNKIWDKYLE